jgi:multisubunit Na+/H+ antiporter MnhB subunit
MAFENRTIRRVAAVVFSFLNTAGFYLLAWVTQRPGGDDGLLMVTAFTLGIIGCSVIMRRQPSEPRNSFVRLFLASCLVAFLPCSLFVVFGSIKYSYGVGGIVFAILLFGILMTVSAVISLPFVAISYFRREKLLSVYQKTPIDVGSTSVNG